LPLFWIRLAAVGVILLGVAAVATAHLASPSAQANGRVIEWDLRTAGTYQIGFGKIPKSPVVGNFYLSILITDTASTAPVLGADVIVSAMGPPIEGEASPASALPETGPPETGPPEIGPIVVNPDPDPQNYPGYYDTEQPIVLDRPGMWTFTVRVDSPEADEATAQFPVEVTTPNPITGIITLVTLLAFIVVVALAIRMYIREKRRSRST
jgi:hypothetical protein